MLALDKWLANTDTRQAVFLRGMLVAKFTEQAADQFHGYDAVGWSMGAMIDDRLGAGLRWP